MKIKSLYAFIITAVILSSCAEKTVTCKLDHEDIDGLLSVRYTYQGDNIVLQEYIDSIGQTDARNVFSFGPNGIIDTVNFYYSVADTLGFTNIVFSGSGKIDSLQQWLDSDYDQVADQYARTFIYNYTGGQITTIEQRIPGSVPDLALTLTWSGNNLFESRNAYTGKYYHYTYSSIKNPYYQYMYYQNFTASGSSAPPSEYMITQRVQYDSLDVLLNTVDYQPSSITDGVQIYYPASSVTKTIKFACTEQ